MTKGKSKVRLTAGRVAEFRCPEDKSQAFLWDTEAPTLAVRASPGGRKTYVFEARLNGSTVRINIGTVTDWPIEQARVKAQGLKMQIDSGIDPREVERERQAAVAEKKAQDEARIQAAKVAALTVAEVWKDYLIKRRPYWGDLHYRDHLDKASPGGQPSKRRGSAGQLTKPGPLASLMAMPIKELNAAVIGAWATREGLSRPSSARLALRLLTVFLTWCREQPEYAALLPSENPAKTKKAREALGRSAEKKDVLQRGQLAAWFEHVQKIENPVISAYLQTLLLTGARPGEVLRLRWEDVNTMWKGLTIRDKVEGSREIPLTSYVAKLLTTLPRRNGWVFPSTKTLSMDPKNVNRRARKAEAAGIHPTAAVHVEKSVTGHIASPNSAHTRACVSAGLNGLTLHGLRRSFKSLTEWLEVPVGVVAQIQGHKPSATAEKHYTVRPLELLALHHQRIELWMLEQARLRHNVQPAARELLTA